MIQHSEDSDDELLFHEATDQLRVTQQDIALLPRDVWRTPDPTIRRLSTRMTHLRGISHLKQIDDEIQHLYKRGLNVHESNASYLEYFRFQTTDPDSHYDDVLQYIMKKKRDLELERKALRVIVKRLEPGTDIFQLVKRAEKLRKHFKRVALMLNLIEANLRLTSLHHSTMSIFEIGDHKEQYKLPPPQASLDIFKIPEDITKEAIEGFEQNVMNFWTYRFHLCNDDFLELFTRLRDCEEFDGKGQLVDNLLLEYDEFEAWSQEMGNAAGWGTIHREINAVSHTNPEHAWCDGMKMLVNIIETSCKRTEFRLHVYEANNVRKQHYVVQIRGFVPKLECFPDLEPRHICEVNFNEISQHYFNYRSCGASKPWTICDKDGNLIPEQADAANREIAQMNQLKKRKWLQEVEVLPDT